MQGGLHVFFHAHMQVTHAALGEMAKLASFFCAICLHAVLQYQKRVCLVNCIDYLTYQYALHGQNSGFWVKSCKIWHMRMHV